MALADLLGLGSTLGAPLTPDQIAALPYVNVPQQPSAQVAPPAAPAAAAPQAPSKLRNLLGAIGDALLVAHGEQPLYHQRMIEQRTQSALQNYLGDPQGSIAQLMKVNAPEGIQLLSANAKARYDYERGLPPELRDLAAMGIDPSSPQGQSILQSKLGKTPNAVIAEYQYYRQNGGRLGFGDFVRLVHPPAGGTLEEQGGSGDSEQPVPTQSQGALRLDPDSGQWVPE